jgi:hypothetical protein
MGNICVQGEKALPNNENVCQVTECFNDGDCQGGDYGCKGGKCERQCKEDEDCAYTGLPVCADGYCEGCATKSDCGTNQTCMDNTCYTNCENNNHCPSFYSCSSTGLCAWTGCTSDEECKFMEGSAYARCSPDKTCENICESDANCGGLKLCVDGLCKDPGCTSDLECKASIAAFGFPSGIVGIACVSPVGSSPIYTQATGVPISDSEEEGGEVSWGEEGGEVSWGEEGGEAVPNENFTCNDGSDIPYDYYSDGYCDCDDCEDEPEGNRG